MDKNSLLLHWEVEALGPLESLVSTKRPGTRKIGEALVSDDEQDGGETEQVLASDHLVFPPAAAQGTREGLGAESAGQAPPPGWVYPGGEGRCLFSQMQVKEYRPQALPYILQQSEWENVCPLCCSGFLPAVGESSFLPGRGGIRNPNLVSESPGPHGYRDGPVLALNSNGEGSSPELAQSSYVFCLLCGQMERSRSLETDELTVQPQFCCWLMMTQSNLQDSPWTPVSSCER